MKQEILEDILIRLKLISASLKIDDLNQAIDYINILTEKFDLQDLVTLKTLIITNDKKNATILIEQILESYENINRIFSKETPKKLVENEINQAENNNFVLFKFKKDDKWGFKDYKNNTIIDCIYDDVLDFYEFKAAVKMGEKWGFINRIGEVCCDFIYDEVKSYAEGMAAVMVITNDYYLLQERKQYIEKWGYINHDGELAIPIQYHEVEKFSEGLAMVKKIVNYSEGMSWFEMKYKYGFIDKSGNIMIDFRDCVSDGWDVDNWAFHNKAFIFMDGRCKIYIESGTKRFNRDAIINKSGDIILSNINYDNIRSYSEGLSAVARVKELLDSEGQNYFDHKWGFVDLNGNEVIDCKFDNVGSFKEGIAPVCIDNTWGFINKKGDLIINCKFKAVRQFSEGLAAAYQEVPNLDKNSNYKTYKWGFIDTSGKTVIPFIYDSYYMSDDFLPCCNSFNNGRAKVQKVDNNQPNYSLRIISLTIDKEGNLINDGTI